MKAASSLALLEPTPHREHDEILSWSAASDAFVGSVRQWAGEGPEFERPELSRVACAQALREFWRLRADDEAFDPWCSVEIPFSLRRAALDLVRSLDGNSILESGFLLSSLYTRLLPEDVRSELGAYYTPPQLAERLLDLATAEGTDWPTVTVLDPACGGGAFLLPVAHRILADHRVRKLSAQEQLQHLEAHLFGIEIDEFAAWMTATLLKLLVFPLSKESTYQPRFSIEEQDSISHALISDRKFDLVVGNPPFRRLTLSAELRSEYQRSLFGHANTYGLFLDAALRWRAPHGLVAFITPTSFLGGQYFCKLRDLIAHEAPPLVIDVIEERKGVFPSVLQETCLAVFGTNPQRSTVVHHLSATDRSVVARRAGTFRLDTKKGAPWLLPRSAEQAELVGKSATARNRLHDLGYKASTGPLVWNRHKSQLRKRRQNGVFPLIWAEAVRANRFVFEYSGRSHAPYFAVEDSQQHLVSRSPCVLVQRTTAKEQDRRLVACAVPADFLAEWSGMVIENHVNVLKPLGTDAVCAEALAAVLNTSAVDLLFRSISGSVAVSASELHAIPLPDRDLMVEVEDLLGSEKDPDSRRKRVERMVADWYGIGFDE